jgi:cytoskeletal protein RodZ
MASTTTILGLEEARRKRGISLERIAGTTKISTRFLRAIECEEFDKLPGGVFNTNYIRQYASAIGFPADKVLAQYEEFERARAAEEATPTPMPVRRALTLRCMNWLRGTATATRP